MTFNCILVDSILLMVYWITSWKYVAINMCLTYTAYIIVILVELCVVCKFVDRWGVICLF